MVEKRDQDDDRDRHTKKPEQNPAAQMTLLRKRQTARLKRGSPHFVPEGLIFKQNPAAVALESALG
jgi:hypothetical protein